MTRSIWVPCGSELTQDWVSEPTSGLGLSTFQPTDCICWVAV